MSLDRRAAGAALCFVACATLSSAASRPEVTREIARSVTVRAGQTIRLEHHLGHVRVQGRPGSTVEVKAHVRVSAEDRQEAERIADEIRVEVGETASIA